MGLGAILLIASEPTALTLTGAFLTGLGGGLLLVTIQASLSDRHGDKRAVALTESNVVASLCAILAPLLIGGFQSIGLGWRSAIGLGVALVVIAFIFFRREHIPEKLALAADEENNPLQTNRLPLVFWFYWAAIFFGVCCEICISFWSADYLRVNAGLSETSAASFVSLFFIAMAVGRTVGSYLVRHFESSQLLLIAISIVGVGFPVFWLVTDPAPKIAGLFVLGLGIANFFPLGLAAATGAAPRQAGMVSSRVTLGAGAGVLGAPLALGWVADRVGLTIAFGIFPVFLGLVLAAILAARKTQPHKVLRASL
jgi:fucose permease